MTVAGNEVALYPHGTHVAGIISAVRNNAQGVAGVCDQCEVLPIVFDPGTGDEGLAAAIRLAVRMDAQVINMSLELRDQANPVSASCSTAFPLTRAAVAEATGLGVTLVASVGNHGTTFDGGASPNQRRAQNVSPASCAGVISVGATDQFGSRSSYTNLGAMLMAPGGGTHVSNNGHAGAFGAGVGCTLRDGGGAGDIPATATAGVLSTWRDGANASTCYRHLSGTSMAAPHVAGVVGLMLAANPRLTPAQIRDILQNPANATPVPGCTSADCGAGMLNAERAVNMALGTAGTAVAYKGVCRLAMGEPCTIDTFDELPNGNLSVTAYGKVWNFDAYGALIGSPTALTNLTTYTRADGPCGPAHRHPSGLCRFQTRSVVDYPGAGVLDSVYAVGSQGVLRYWNFNAAGSPFGPQGDPARSVARYQTTGAAGASICVGNDCQMDSRLVVNFPEWGGIIESIESRGFYFNFNGAGQLLGGVSGNGPLTSIARYAEVCQHAPSGQPCKFDARELKSDRTEVIFAYGRYFEFSSTGALVKTYELSKPRACFSPEICNPYR